MALSTKSCTPCEGGVEPMTREQAQAMLAEVPGWALTEGGKSIVRRFERKDFVHALALVNRIGELAEREGHHPDITFGWGYVTVELYTHKIGGLHENDFILAAKINRLTQ
mgnify:CR=1 FL=1